MIVTTAIAPKTLTADELHNIHAYWCPEILHQQMAETLDAIVYEIKAIQYDARTNGFSKRPQYPMIVLKTPKGWTGPKVVDGIPVEGTFRSHQVPLAELATKPEHIKLLEEWMKSYKPEELFDKNGRLIEELAELAPKGDRRMGVNPHANGGLLLKDLKLPNFCDRPLVVRQVNNAWFVVSASPLKSRTKVLTTNLFTHQS